MDEKTIEQLATLMSDKICKVCVDRNVDGACDRRAEGTCTLMAKLPLAAEAVLKVSSDRMEPYIESIRENVCSYCDLRYLASYFPAQKSELHFWIEPSSIRWPAPRCSHRRIDEYVWGMLRRSKSDFGAWSSLVAGR